MTVGIYMIKNKINNKVYIGESKDVHERWKGHTEDLLSGSHNRKMNSDVAKYGVDSFEFSVIKEVPRMGLSVFKHKLLRLVYEDFYIRKYDSVNKGYNCQYTLNCVRDGRKKILDTNIGLKTINIMADILYGVIDENNGEYSIEYEVGYRKKHNLSDIDKKTLLNSKLRGFYSDYKFIDTFIKLINDNKKKIVKNMVVDIIDYDEDSDMLAQSYQEIDLYISFINRFSFAIAEYICVLMDIDEDCYDYTFISDYLSIDEFKIIKNDILDAYNSDEIRGIRNAIFYSASILYYDNDFEIPSNCVENSLMTYAFDYNEFVLIDHDIDMETKSYAGGFDDIIDLFSSYEEMMEYLESN